ncbi:hypothetical protein NL676_038602 [Syzygium grande]|nr:hypothetical protein NL676_038602 [Syzygium grande]
MGLTMALAHGPNDLAITKAATWGSTASGLGPRLGKDGTAWARLVGYLTTVGHALWASLSTVRHALVHESMDEKMVERR